jgi:hypothetical protein
VVLSGVAGFLLTLQLVLFELSAEWRQPGSRVRQARAARNPRDLAAYPTVSWSLYACGGGCLGRVCRRLQGRQPSWLSPVANVIHAPTIDRQHLGCDEAGIRLDQESHGGGNVLRRANPTDHGALAH